MPNWCEGTLKLRGEFTNLKRFVLEGLKVVDYSGKDVDRCYEVRENSSDSLWITDIKYGNLYIKGTRRHFIECENIEIYDCDKVICLPMKAAWNINSESLVQISKEYNIDVRIHAYERGAQFERDIIVIGGELVRNETISHGDYSWDCDCPLIGG